jgi:hypothetical protein
MLKDNEPCSHKGCLHHITHPCEGCGRIGGIMEKDTVVDYSATKLIDDVNIEKMCLAIVNYIQNNEIYFHYTPAFKDGCLIFGVVGFKSAHTKLQLELTNSLNELGVELSVLLERR